MSDPYSVQADSYGSYGVAKNGALLLAGMQLAVADIWCHRLNTAYAQGRRDAIAETEAKRNRREEL